MKSILKSSGLFMLRWGLAAILFNAVTAPVSGFALSMYYWIADGYPVWQWLAQEFGGYFFKNMLGWLFALLVYPPMQRSVLMLFGALIDTALRTSPTGAQKGTLRPDKA